MSWRVVLLPYIEQKALYNQFCLDEPWDSISNIRLLKEMPRLYDPPYWGPKTAPYHTYYHVFVGAETAFGECVGFRYPEDFPAPDKTIVIVQGGPAVAWTKPDDIIYRGDIPLPNLNNARRRGFDVGLLNGAIRFIREGTPEEDIRRAIERKSTPASPR